MYTSRTIYVALVMAWALIPAAGSASSGPRSREISAYAMDVAFDLEEKTLSGTADLVFANPQAGPDTLELFLHGELRFTHASCHGADLDGDQELVFYPADYSSVANRLRLIVEDADLAFGLQIAWEGPMNPSAARAPSDYMRIDHDGVFLRSHGYSLWFPMPKAPEGGVQNVDFTSVTLRVPSGYTAIFTGSRLEEYSDEESAVSVWAAPNTSFFDTQCSVRPYEVLEDDGVFLYHLADDQSRENANRIMTFTRQLRDFFGDHYRRGVTEENLHVAQLCKFGNISSGNMIGLSDDVWREFQEGSYSGQTLAHELVHSYVDIPTAETEDVYALMKEGFPSYLHLPALADELGEPWYDDLMAQIEQDYLEKRKTGKTRRGRDLPKAEPILNMTSDDIGKYKDLYIFPDRVRLWFDHLRFRLGPEGFLSYTADLANLDHLDEQTLRQVTLAHDPGFEEFFDLWLATDEYPASLRRPQ